MPPLLILLIYLAVYIDAFLDKLRIRWCAVCHGFIWPWRTSFKHSTGLLDVFGLNSAHPKCVLTPIAYAEFKIYPILFQTHIK